MSGTSPLAIHFCSDSGVCPETATFPPFSVSAIGNSFGKELQPITAFKACVQCRLLVGSKVFDSGLPLSIIDVGLSCDIADKIQSDSPADTY